MTNTPEAAPPLDENHTSLAIKTTPIPQVSKKPKRVTALDGLRGALSVIILIGHLLKDMEDDHLLIDQNSITTAFNVLSGMGTYLGYGAILYSTAKFRKFLKKRVVKILPVYYLSLAMFLPLLLRDDWWNDSAIILSLITNPLLLQSVLVGWQRWNDTMWQISLFMVFYLLYPLLHRSIVSRSWKANIALHSVVWALLTGTAYYVTFYHWFYRHVVYKQFLFRLVQFAAGMLLGKAFREGHLESMRPWTRFVTDSMSAILLLDQAFFLVYTRITESQFVHNYLGYVTSHAFLPLHLLWIAGMVLDEESRSWTSRLMNTRVFQALGGISLELYMFHYVVFGYLKWAFGYASPFQIPLCFLISLFLSKLVQAAQKKWM